MYVLIIVVGLYIHVSKFKLTTRQGFFFIFKLIVMFENLAVRLPQYHILIGVDFTENSNSHTKLFTHPFKKHFQGINRFKILQANLKFGEKRLITVNILNKFFYYYKMVFRNVHRQQLYCDHLRIKIMFIYFLGIRDFAACTYFE